MARGRSLNKVMLIGNLGRDPEVKYMPNGRAVANFSIATSESWTNKEGKLEEKTEWHRIVVFGKAAEACKEWLSKGKQVYVEGRLQTREWQDKNGQKRTSTDIVADRIIFLGGKGEGPTEPATEAGEGGGPEEITYEPVGNDEDIPF